MRCMYLCLLAVLLFGLFTDCNNSPAKQTPPVSDTLLPKKLGEEAIAGNFSTQAQLFFDSVQLDSFLKAYPQLTKLKKNMQTFYSNRKYAYAWFDEKGMIEQASNLYNHIMNMNEEGLPVKIPYKDSFTAIMESSSIDTAKPAVATELMLTAQYFVYAGNVWQGLDEKESTSLNWYLPRKKVSYNQLLDSLLGTGKGILDTAPVYRQYGLLKTQLKKYRDIASGGGFPIINAEKKSYKKGDSSAVIDSMRKYLFLADDIAANNNSATFDDELEAGIKNFQQRLGYTDDGIAGANVLNEMKVPVQKRIEQIEVNMERSRWVPVKV
ncbi:MAG TPA: peptidoglycan-binding protein, partial [Chitinophagaceae bacterium]|nr:peptidoglycan-binding protein [Chitinophagaceae bacterium]